MVIKVEFVGGPLDGHFRDVEMPDDGLVVGLDPGVVRVFALVGKKGQHTPKTTGAVYHLVISQNAKIEYRFNRLTTYSEVLQSQSSHTSF